MNFENETRFNGPTGVVIYGAGNAGKQIFNELQKNKEKVLFFIDDNTKLQNTNFNGVPIINFQNLLNVRKYNSIKKSLFGNPISR